MIQTVFYRRDFSNRENYRGHLQVQSMSWDCIGGCDTAEVLVTGSNAGVWDLIEFLRCPVEMYNERAQALWWGYVESVRIRQGAFEFGLSIENLYNRIAVAYSFIEEGGNEVGQRKTTAWAEGTASMAEYGTKELLASASGMTDTSATAKRDLLLASLQYPHGDVQQFGLGQTSSFGASITCSGWWKTLGWQYASVASGAGTATTAQIQNLATSYGEFIVDTIIEDASGITSNPYRAGDTTARDEIETLLRVGTTSGKRLLATVRQDRRLIVYEEPANTDIIYTLDSCGVLSVRNSRQPLYLIPVGQWVRLRNVLPATYTPGKVADPSLQFIERAEWTPQGLTPEFRSQPTASDILWSNE